MAAVVVVVVVVVVKRCSFEDSRTDVFRRIEMA